MVPLITRLLNILGLYQGSDNPDFHLLVDWSHGKGITITVEGIQQHADIEESLDLEINIFNLNHFHTVKEWYNNTLIITIQ